MNLIKVTIGSIDEGDKIFIDVFLLHKKVYQYRVGKKQHSRYRNADFHGMR